MRILVIGGTSFIGLHVIEQAQTRGHELTMFNRGLTNGDDFPGVERLFGDRERADDLAALADRDWDAVVDTCGFDFRVVRLSADRLAGHVGHYTFLSSLAVYADFSHANREDDELKRLEGDIDASSERAIGGSSLYGPMKVACEQVVDAAFPGRALMVRLTAGAGPGDHGASTRRMAYWGARVRDHDQVLVPGPPDRLVAYIDVRDMAAWIVEMAERGGHGPYNLAAPPLTIARFLDLAAAVYGTDPELVWAAPEWLLEQGVAANTELPWWVPGAANSYMLAIDGSKAMADGLRIRPIEETLRDSVLWEDGRPPLKDVPRSPFAGQALGASMARERELSLIEAWRAREREAASA